MQSKAATVAEYLASLPTDRREIVQALREVVLKNLDKNYQEVMQYGMIGYAVPHSVYPPGYHCDAKQPLPFAAIASQKQHVSVYLMGLYVGGAITENAESRWFRTAWEKTGNKLDMGKSCVRFNKLENVPLEVIGEAIRRMPAKKYIATYESVLATTRARKSAPAKPATKKVTKKVAKKTPAKTTNKPKRP
jgi:hypothetical protein